MDAINSEVYEELRRVAGRYLASERADHTLQPTALVHEAYMRLTGRDLPGLEGRGHFIAIAARVMRQVLVDHAKAHRAQKRGGGRTLLSLENVDFAAPQATVDVSDLDEAITQLSSLDPRLAELVELRFFGGLSMVEVAEALGMAQRTLEREWSLARAWLYRWMTEERT